jgi:enamine deaminase RidA (YjgF/YER057c/UK114 family)
VNEFIDPPGLAAPRGYTHVVRSTAARVVVHVSGQVAYDPAGAVVGQGDLRRQAEVVYENVGRALAAAGAGWSDVVKTTILVLDMTPEKIAVVRDVRRRFVSGSAPPASTLVSVNALAHPDLLIEVEATAMLD